MMALGGTQIAFDYNKLCDDIKAEPKSKTPTLVTVELVQDVINNMLSRMDNQTRLAFIEKFSPNSDNNAYGEFIGKIARSLNTTLSIYKKPEKTPPLDFYHTFMDSFYVDLASIFPLTDSLKPDTITGTSTDTDNATAVAEKIADPSKPELNFFLLTSAGNHVLGLLNFHLMKNPNLTEGQVKNTLDNACRLLKKLLQDSLLNKHLIDPDKKAPKSALQEALATFAMNVAFRVDHYTLSDADIEKISDSIKPSIKKSDFDKRELPIKNTPLKEKLVKKLNEKTNALISSITPPKQEDNTVEGWDFVEEGAFEPSPPKAQTSGKANQQRREVETGPRYAKPQRSPRPEIDDEPKRQRGALTGRSDPSKQNKRNKPT